MRVKRLYYDKPDTMVVSFVVYSEDLSLINQMRPRYLEVAKGDDNVLNALHGLIMIGNLLERHKDERKAIRAGQIQAQSKVPGV